MEDNLIFDNEHIWIRTHSGWVSIVHKATFGNIQIPEADFELACSVFLHLQGYDVTKREPELKPCPVCGGEATKMISPNGYGYVECSNCRLRQMDDQPEGLAIEAWNAIPRKDYNG